MDLNKMVAPDAELLLNQEGVSITANEEVPSPAPKKKSRKKSDKPSDKTIIRNLKKEIEELKQKLESMEDELARQRGKAETYFERFMRASKEVDEYKDTVDRATSLLSEGVGSAMNAFFMIIRK